MATLLDKLFGENKNKKNVNDIINDAKRGKSISQDDLDRANEHLKAQGKPELIATVHVPPQPITKQSLQDANSNSDNKPAA